MSTGTRRERERATVRESMVAVALALLEREGAAALTVRRVAGEVEYTAPVVYQHFANKQALLLALVEVGYERLRERMAAAARTATTTDDRLLAPTGAYVRFAGDNPHLYALMNNTAVDPHDRFRAAAPITRLVVDLMTGWAAEHGVVLASPVEACEVAWGTLYGIASLGQLDTIGFDRAAHLADRALRALMLTWRTHPDGDYPAA
ncbi:TetR/AcrR family transcriptional regulator [Actinokineospora terrae]|uniref:Transcriptional regulator, TetR family n=1 Tax=Actinokineospora terrae TaxID=155974 RepID=A0A1H9TB90_9PSEU|nr:TetR/AcrR family transcriptional regulator [Actinokineospora terrae]SER94049.1 transcriptional regulator, TetR family [Actinokineospora terrae]